ncbi:dCTP deaminase domain-containing protein [Pseudopedobacter beijingensis]|uniref:Deoxycytidine triphosphate deaminase n=1 Tax=Pseudopedobacter beijingensis TaxID=1207056 RepID=A0ABW4IGD9_9SPHI
MGFLGTNELRQILPNCIDKFDDKRIDNVAYELSLGEEAYLTDSKSGKKEKLDDKNTQIVIKSGQFALLLTDEVVSIPDDLIAFISIKFSQKIKGLINVSGFHVDPGFKGKIIFSVYNAGPTNIVLDKGNPYFMIWFSNLTSSSLVYNGKHKGQNSISGEVIHSLNGELASPNVLLDRIKSNESKLTNFSWAAGVIMSIGLGLSVKTCSDNSKFNEGYQQGLKERKIEVLIDSAIQRVDIDSVINDRIEKQLKQKKDDSKK